MKIVRKSDTMESAMHLTARPVLLRLAAAAVFSFAAAAAQSLYSQEKTAAPETAALTPASVPQAEAGAKEAAAKEAAAKEAAADAAADAKAAEIAAARAEALKKEDAEHSQRMLVEQNVEAQEAEKTASEFYVMGRKEYEMGHYREAIGFLLQAREHLRDGKEDPALTEKQRVRLEDIRQLLGKAYYNRALELFNDAEKKADSGNYDEAIKLSEDAIENYPLCKDIMEKMIEKYKRLKEYDEYRADISYEAADPEAKNRDLTIEREMRKGQNFYKTGQWTKARDHFNAVIREDPYNEMAIDYLRRCYEKIIQTGRVRHSVITQERAAEAGWNSISPIVTAISSDDANPVVIPQQKVDSTKNIEGKLRSIIIPRLDFEDQTLQEVVKTLRERSKALDPDKNGVNILLLLTKDAPKKSAEKQDGTDESAADDSGDEESAGDEEESEEESEEEEESDETEAADGEGTPSAAGRGKHMIDYLKVDNVDLRQAIELICDAADVRYRIEPHAVIIADSSVPLDEMDVRVFVVESDALPPEILGGGGDGEGGSDTSEALRNYFVNNWGVPFAVDAGASIKYDEAVSRLIVNNTPEALAQIGDIIDSLNDKTATQVMVQVKFVEVAVNDLEELGFEYVVSRPDTGNSVLDYYTPITQGTYTASEDMTLVYRPHTTGKEESVNGAVVKRGTPLDQVGEYYPIFEGDQYTIPDSDENSDPSTTPYYKTLANTTALYGRAVTFGPNSQLVRNAQEETSSYMNNESVGNDTVLGWAYHDGSGWNFGAKVHALDQADSTDILSAPRITTLAGEEAVIRMVTEKYYPKEWNEATIETVSGNNGGDRIPVFVPSTPTFDDPINEGIVLNVRPEVEENYTITLQMTPTIQSFIDWTDYSYMIPLESNGTTLYYPNTLKMPIIEARTVETTVISYDGETIVLGGVIRDRVSIVEDQYPILGDIPLVGRLFQSKGHGSEKTNLLIFLTSRLILPDGTPIRQNEERGVPAFKY